MIGKTQYCLGPAATVHASMAQRGMLQGPFFVSPDDTLLTKARFSVIVKAALEELGLPQEQFGEHSFQIGAATTVAQPGLEVSMIMMSGRWNRTAFLRYLRTPRESLASASACQSLKPMAVVDNGIAIPLLLHVYSYS